MERTMKLQVQPHQLMAPLLLSQRVMVLFKEIKDEKLYEPEIEPLAK